VTKEEDWARAVEAVLAAQGRVDVLVQAAGITGKTGIKTAEVDPANWDAVMAVNARGIFLGCRAVLPAMVKADYGRIVNIASVAGKEGNAGMAPYSASKGAVIALTKSIGKEYAETGEVGRTARGCERAQDAPGDRAYQSFSRTDRRAKHPRALGMPNHQHTSTEGSRACGLLQRVLWAAVPPAPSCMLLSSSPLDAGITCNALAPAVIRTAMVEAMPAEQVKYMTGA
jgi:NAD(P)-dependent dehydrogenase (short-subunit alcohol dehydrogenase family)